jgi:hypothetical protein
MKIIYEVGDFVKVMDDFKAGALAACSKAWLLEKIDDETWLAKDDSVYQKGVHELKEEYIYI